MTKTAPRTVNIDRRFNGPDKSGNGGYVAGLVGSALVGDTAGAATVDLRTPPPLEHDLALREHGDGLDLLDGSAVVAAGRHGALDAEEALLATVGLDAARRAAEAYTGLHDHPFPNCFGCGVNRSAGDGLRVFSGPLPDGRMACPWTPHERFGDAAGLLAPEFMWAALDCPGGWAAGIEDNPMVLARMTVSLYRRPRVGEQCIVLGALREVVRRKNATATALYADDGELLGRADQLWIAVDLADFS